MNVSNQRRSLTGMVRNAANPVTMSLQKVIIPNQYIRQAICINY